MFSFSIVGNKQTGDAVYKKHGGFAGIMNGKPAFLSA
jgi:hypothetical protein